MVTQADALKIKRRSVGRFSMTLLAGAAACALAAASVRAETGVAATPEPAPVAIPAPANEQDFATGAIDEATPTAPAAPNALTPTAPAALSPMAPQPIAENLAPLPAAIAALLAETGPTAQVKMSVADRQALVAFYTARKDEPIWIKDGHLSPKASAAKDRIAKAADDALDARDFRLPGDPATGTPADVARAEVQMSAVALSYARKAWGGRVKPGVVSPSITVEGTPFDAAQALASLEQSQDVAAALDAFNPQAPQFQELRKLLHAARADRKDQPDLPRIDFGKLIEPGMDDPRVPALRKRLGLFGAPDDLYYDSELQDAVVAFQKKSKIGASGLINKQTVRALNAVSRPHDDADLIEINMERWRWTPRDLGTKHVFVDIPAYRLHIMQDGASTYDTRVIVGKSTNQTPIFSNEIDHIVVNPYWNVPSTIALKEMQGSSLKGFEVVDSRGRPAALDWEGIRTNKLRIRQPPGERNALGNIKFMFPNSHAVYLHDTPTRKMFERNERALSHGCVRVDRPLEFADALSGDQGLSGAKLKSMVGGKERSLTLKSPIPVHLTYFTAWVGPDGKLETRNDFYSLDGRLKAALKGEPLPPLPKPAAPQVIAKPKPKPTAAQTAEAQAAAVPAPQQQRVASPGDWLSRIFGSSR
ncbi:L,D-transpeptidase family protein [Chenggangzhangella methanolivorans]|uniref:L,D-transpeptidase family protein n=1 Tax=Chenggangzhangella methanolivorans TaxID=1437009 RepID=A0A9E6UGC3_9HYPH|nr:L,D-transpeptidase family protein [Chenggangzhangella methanolivorans]QZN98592.1 L,D-transpeptidase family protein [Chenggangzhangella methanolivorans]